jgi:hypothetical protein
MRQALGLAKWQNAAQQERDAEEASPSDLCYKVFVAVIFNKLACFEQVK